MNGCTAPIMRTWPMGRMNRVPRVPQRFAQSNTGRCDGLKPGAPSTVRLPASGGCSPEMSRSSELLPQPEGPTTAMNSPFVMPRETSSMALTAAAPRP